MISVNPLFRDQDLTFEPALIGTWTTPCSEASEKAKACQLAFASSDQKTYSVEYTDEKGVAVKFDGYLGRLGKNLYLDVVPQSSELKGMSEAAEDHALLAHSFWKLSLKKDELTLASLRSDPALKQALHTARMRTGVKRATSKWESDYNLLLGSTQELQRFFAAYGAKPEAWESEPAVWRRQ
ncbi:MAG: hypothetical protein ACRD3A_05165 [Terriglobales bacterium]